MKTRLKWTAAGALAGFCALQLFNPPRVNPPVKSDFGATLKPPPAVASALRAACYDCHSDETVWPLYSRIAPVSWLVASDVNGGREHLNFSEWPADASSSAKRLNRINEALDYREMPPKKYTLLHPAARLTESQRQAIMKWTDDAAASLHPAGSQ